VGDHDPASTWIADGAVDRRGGPIGQPTGDDVVISGPGDLRELADAVESVTGAGTWPLARPVLLPWPDAVRSAPAGTAVEITANAAMALVVALGDELEDRGAMWRTRRTLYDVIDASLRTAELRTVTVVAVRARPGTAS